MVFIGDPAGASRTWQQTLGANEPVLQLRVHSVADLLSTQDEPTGKDRIFPRTRSKAIIQLCESLSLAEETFR